MTLEDAVKQTTEKQFNQFNKNAAERKKFIISSIRQLKGAFNNLQHAKELAINPYEKKEIDKELEQLIQCVDTVKALVKKYE